MALKRATKSIPLSGGITEEVDDILLEAPGMQYMENVRFTKLDVAEKRRPLTAGVTTGVSNATGHINGLWAQGTKVAVVGNDEVAMSYDGGATFASTSQKTDLLGIESILRTAEVSGGANYSWCPYGTFTSGSPDTWVISGYLVAYERITMRPQTGTNSRDVVVQDYETDGSLKAETTYTDCFAPKCKPGATRGYVSMVTGTGDIDTYHISPGGALTGPNTLAASVNDYCQAYESVGPDYNNLSFEAMRLGYARALMENNAAFDLFYDKEATVGVYAYKSGGSLFWRATDVDGVPTGSSQTVANDTGASSRHKLLDVHTDGTHMFTLYADMDTSTNPPTHDILISKEVIAGGTPTVYTITSGQSGLPINGSTRTDSAGNHWTAYTVADGNPDDNQYAADAHRVKWAKHSSIGAALDGGTFWAHRMCSDIAIDKSDDAYFAAQQWANWNPGVGGATPYATTGVPQFTPTHKKPVTTVLVSCVRDTDNQLHATFDAGQSKACLAGEDEQSIHMSGDLYYWDQNGEDGAHQFWYGNRVLLESVNSFYYSEDADATPNYAPVPGSEGRTALHPGASRFACYRMQSSVYVPSVNFSNGMFMGTAVPSWFDGSSYLSVMQLVDSPEILGWYSDGNIGDYMFYQVTNDTDRLAQIVIGYYDDAGLVHRSAPSVPVYLGGVGDPSANTGSVLTAKYTPPIGLIRDREYFVEVYEAFPGNDPQLAATMPLEDTDASVPKEISWTSILRPTNAATPRLEPLNYTAGKTIYTAGNVLAADPWPNFDAVVASGRRLFAHSISDPSTIYYSKTFENGIVPEFSASLTITIGNEKITALGTMDDKVIAFSDSNCWLINGVGPDNTGVNGDFFVERMPANHGCTDQDSVLTYEEGIAFYSSTTNEFVVIGRDLQVADLGQNIKVSSENITNIRDAVVVPLDHELRWYCDYTAPNLGQTHLLAGVGANDYSQPSRPFLNNILPDNPVFVYNYKYQKWSVGEEDAISFAKTVVTEGVVGGVMSNFVFRKESTVHDDWSRSKLCRWETGWIKVNQLQDYGRFYSATFYAKYLSSWRTTAGGLLESGDLQVTVLTDYIGSYGYQQAAVDDVFLWRAAQNMGEDATSTDISDRFQFKIRPRNQKCQAIKFIIQEVASTKVEAWEDTPTAGQGFSLVAVDLEYGTKGGSSRLPAAKKK